MGVFVEITIDDSRFADPEQREVVVGSCPVDIFTHANGRVATIAEREDECILCGMCLVAAPSGGVSVRRRYGRCRPVEMPVR